MSQCDFTFDAMGSHVRVLVSDPASGGLPAPAAAEDARAFIVEFEHALSRFRPNSELCALNADPREEVPASKLLRDTVRAGLWAAERSGGLIDPTLLGEIEAAGYRESRAGVCGASLTAALEAAPPRGPASPSPQARWRSFSVDENAGTVSRPPGYGFDSGGIGKGLAADLVAGLLGRQERFLVDCGGDIRIGGELARSEPFEVHVKHPLSGELTHVFRLGGGAVATSGINVRVWHRADGGYAHHLLDPASGEPAWTGLIAVTALGGNAVEAETLSKASLLSGPQGARALLERQGGLIVHDSGKVELVGSLNIRPRISLPLPVPTEAAA